MGTVQSAVELATGRDFIAGEAADRRAAMVGLVPGGKGVVNGAKGIIKAVAPLARQTTILGSAASAANSLRKGVPNGAGSYRAVQGHHVHAKKGFEGHGEYSFRDAFSISDSLLRKYGIRHADLTPIQQRLFRELASSNMPNNLNQHTRIAYQTLVEAGMPKKDALMYVSESLKSLIRAGVTSPTRMPWNPGWQ